MAAGAGTLVISPFSFVGFVAPQVATRLSLTRALPQAAGTALIGAVATALADGVGRTIDAPWQVPCGLMAALLGRPSLLALFGWRRA